MISYCVVAAHDDDVLEDWQNAFQKDPVQLDMPGRAAPLPREEERLDEERRDDEAAAPKSTKKTAAHYGYPSQSAYVQTAVRMSSALNPAGVLLAAASDIGRSPLANRSLEIVKIVVPLQGLARRHPLVGEVPEDAAGTIEAWGHLLPTGRGGFVESKFPSRRQLGAIPRHFVVYVKQRIVVLDVLDWLIEAVKRIKELFGKRGTDSKAKDLREEATKAPQSAVYTKAVEHELVREALVDHLAEKDEVRLPHIYARHFELHEKIKKKLVDEGVEVNLADLKAHDEAFDIQAEEEPAVDALRLTGTLHGTPEGIERFLRSMERRSQQDPAVDNRGRPLGPTLRGEALHGDRLRVWPDSAARTLWLEAARGLEGSPVVDVTPDAEVGEGVLIRDVLRLSGDRANERFGPEETAKIVEGARKAAADLDKAVEALGSAVPPADVSERYHARRSEGLGAKEAFKGTFAEFENDPQSRPYLDKVAKFDSLLDAKTFERVASRLLGEGPPA